MYNVSLRSFILSHILFRTFNNAVILKVNRQTVCYLKGKHNIYIHGRLLRFILIKRTNPESQDLEVHYREKWEKKKIKSLSYMEKRL